MAAVAPLTAVHILPHMAVGGRERMVADLARDLPQHGVDPAVVTLEPLPEGAEAVPIPAHVPCRLSAPPDLAATLAALHPDLLHIHGHNSAVRAFAAGAGAWPTLVTLHMGMEGSWRWLPAIRSALRRANRLVAVSAPLASLYRRISGRAVDVITPGIALPATLPPRQTRAPGAPLRCAMLSRLHPVKCHGDAIAACDRLNARGIAAELHIAGDGPLMPMLQSAAATRPWLTLHGVVDDGPAFLARADILLHPSRHEGTPLAVMEAMAHGVPVIASRVGGIPALTGTAALLVPPGAPARLANAIATLHADPVRAAAMAALAATRVAAHGTDGQAARYAALYTAIAALHQPAAAA